MITAMLSRQPSKEGHAGQFGKQDVRFGVEVEGHENPGAFAGDRGDAMQGVPPPEEDERLPAPPCEGAQRRSRRQDGKRARAQL